MPQMSPIYWLFLLTYFILMLMMMISFTFFFFFPMNLSKLTIMSKDDSMIWMW